MIIRFLREYCIRLHFQWDTLYIQYIRIMFSRSFDAKYIFKATFDARENHKKKFFVSPQYIQEEEREKLFFLLSVNKKNQKLLIPDYRVLCIHLGRVHYTTLNHANACITSIACTLTMYLDLTWSNVKQLLCEKQPGSSAVVRLASW